MFYFLRQVFSRMLIWRTLQWLQQKLRWLKVTTTEFFFQLYIEWSWVLCFDGACLTWFFSCFFGFFWVFFGSCRDAGNLMDHVLSWVSEDWSDGTNFLTELHCIVIGLEVNFSPNLMAIQGLTNSRGRAWMWLNRSWLVWHRFKRVNMWQNCVLISEMDIDFAFGVVKNSLVILFTLCHTILLMWVWRIWYRIN